MDRSYWRLAGVLAAMVAPLLYAGCGSILGIDDGQPLADASSDFTSTETGSGSGGGDSTTGDDSSDGPAPHDGGTDVVTGDGGDAGCAPGTTRCAGQTPQLCNSMGQWTPESACVNQACATNDAGMASCVGVCAPGAMQCDPDAGAAVDTCGPDGQWGSPSACTGTVCSSGGCGVCQPGTTRCDLDAGVGVDTCGSTGQWGSPQPCKSSACTGGMCSGSCTNGTYECSGNVSQVCSGGMWTTNQDCTSAGMACLSATGKCGGSCVPGTQTCASVGNGYQVCGQNGTYGGIVGCVMQTCVGGMCQGNCAPGYQACSGNNAQTCDGSGNTVSTDCTTLNETCVSGVCSGSCVQGQTQPCGNCGSQTCGSTGTWGLCVGSGPCSPPQTQSCNTGTCSGSQTCTSSCTWGACMCSSGSSSGGSGSSSGGPTCGGNPCPYNCCSGICTMGPCDAGSSSGGSSGSSSGGCNTGADCSGDGGPCTCGTCTDTGSGFQCKMQTCGTFGEFCNGAGCCYPYVCVDSSGTKVALMTAEASTPPTCGCIPSNHGSCATDVECCSGTCDAGTCL